MFSKLSKISRTTNNDVGSSSIQQHNVEVRDNYPLVTFSNMEQKNKNERYGSQFKDLLE